MRTVQVPVTFHADRVTIGYYIVGVGVAGMLFGWMAVAEDSILYGLGALSMGFLAALLVVQLHPRAAYLTLSAEGFTFASLFKATSIPWSKASRFEMADIPELGERVAWNFLDGYRPRNWRTSTLARFKARTKYDGFLPDEYGFRGSELADLMNRLRDGHAADAKL